jgi:aminoglycoside 3'-phosphotransferase II
MRPEIPQALQPIIRGYRWRKITIGESGADTYRLTAPRRQPLILKHASDCLDIDLKDEANRMAWLAQWAPAPTVLAVAAAGDKQWLVMTPLAGDNALQSSLPPKTKVRVVAEALSALHAISAAECPFDECLDRRIRQARDNVARGLVDESRFDERNAGRTAASLWEELLRTRPPAGDRVVTHGDACLPNFMFDGTTFTGFVDCARVGRADRYQDIALVCRSIEYDLGQEWVAPFLRMYGLPRVDYERLEFYRLLDEFF